MRAFASGASRDKIFDYAKNCERNHGSRITSGEGWSDFATALSYRSKSKDNFDADCPERRVIVALFAEERAKAIRNEYLTFIIEKMMGALAACALLPITALDTFLHDYYCGVVRSLLISDSVAHERSVGKVARAPPCLEHGERALRANASAISEARLMSE